MHEYEYINIEMGNLYCENLREHKQIEQRLYSTDFESSAMHVAK